MAHYLTVQHQFCLGSGYLVFCLGFLGVQGNIMHPQDEMVAN